MFHAYVLCLLFVFRRTEEEVTETTFHRTRRIRRGALDKSGSDSLEEDNTMDRAVMWNQDAAETKNLLSLWDLVSQNREYTEQIQELEAVTQMFTSSPKASSNRSESLAKTINEVDLTGDDNDCSPKVSVVQKATRPKRNSRKEEKTEEVLGNVVVFSLAELFDKTLLSELISEDVWMHRISRVIERNNRASFELM